MKVAAAAGVAPAPSPLQGDALQHELRSGMGKIASGGIAPPSAGYQPAALLLSYEAWKVRQAGSCTLDFRVWAGCVAVTPPGRKGLAPRAGLAPASSWMRARSRVSLYSWALMNLPAEGIAPSRPRRSSRRAWAGFAFGHAGVVKRLGNLARPGVAPGVSCSQGRRVRWLPRARFEKIGAMARPRRGPPTTPRPSAPPDDQARRDSHPLLRFDRAARELILHGPKTLGPVGNAPTLAASAASAAEAAPDLYGPTTPHWDWLKWLRDTDLNRAQRGL